jgi:hypothetical protein
MRQTLHPLLAAIYYRAFEPNLWKILAIGKPDTYAAEAQRRLRAVFFPDVERAAYGIIHCPFPKRKGLFNESAVIGFRDDCLTYLLALLEHQAFVSEESSFCGVYSAGGKQLEELYYMFTWVFLCIVDYPASIVMYSKAVSPARWSSFSKRATDSLKWIEGGEGMYALVSRT